LRKAGRGCPDVRLSLANGDEHHRLLGKLDDWLDSDETRLVPTQHLQWPETFRDAYCRRFRCRSRSYAFSAMQRTVYAHAVVPLLILYPFRTRSVQGALYVLELAGNARNFGEFLRAIDRYHQWMRTYPGIWQSAWKMRVSGQRLIRLQRVLFPQFAGKEHIPSEHENLNE
jgi:hypothetical protein